MKMCKEAGARPRDPGLPSHLSMQTSQFDPPSAKACTTSLAEKGMVVDGARERPVDTMDFSTRGSAAADVSEGASAYAMGSSAGSLRAFTPATSNSPDMCTGYGRKMRTSELCADAVGQLSCETWTDSPDSMRTHADSQEGASTNTLLSTPPGSPQPREMLIIQQKLSGTKIWCPKSFAKAAASAVRKGSDGARETCLVTVARQNLPSEELEMIKKAETKVLRDVDDPAANLSQPLRSSGENMHPPTPLPSLRSGCSSEVGSSLSCHEAQAPLLSRRRPLAKIGGGTSDLPITPTDRDLANYDGSVTMDYELKASIRVKLGAPNTCSNRDTERDSSMHMADGAFDKSALQHMSSMPLEALQNMKLRLEESEAFERALKRRKLAAAESGSFLS